MVDFGTAITFDAISAKGEYLGGVIGPGVRVSMEALAEHAAKLPRVELAEPAGVIGKTTQESMQSGMVFGFAGAIDSIARRLVAELGEESQLHRHRWRGGGDRPPLRDGRRDRRHADPHRAAADLGPQCVTASPTLTEPFSIGDVEIANRVLLAPLAGIGNWFVRLQARRHGAGLAVSEMVSSFGLHYRNERTLRELMRIHPDEHPVSVQLFGHDPEVMRSGAAVAAEAGADLIDINMGCPVRKVLKTGAGAALLHDRELAMGLARGAIEGGGVPVTVKLRSGLEPGDRSGFDLAVELAEEAGVAGIGFHPRSAAVGHKGEPDYALAAELAERLEVPVIISGGLDERRSGAAAPIASRVPTR